MKLASILTIGTYYSPWLPYNIASVYKYVDQIVVVNAGYDLNKPDSKVYNIPVKQASEDIKELDVNGKILEVHIGDCDAPVTTQYAINKGLAAGTDIRGITITLASRKACELGAEWILKTDSDQVLYDDIKNFRNDLKSYMFYQYEFTQDVYHMVSARPDSPYNDSVFTYIPHPHDTFTPCGSPAIVNDARQPTPNYHVAHLRSANPIEYTREQSINHFKDRLSFSYFTNVYGDWVEPVFIDALNTAEHMVLNPGVAPSEVPPPEVTKLSRDKLREYVAKI